MSPELVVMHKVDLPLIKSLICCGHILRALKLQDLHWLMNPGKMSINSKTHQEEEVWPTSVIQ